MYSFNLSTYKSDLCARDTVADRLEEKANSLSSMQVLKISRNYSYTFMRIMDMIILICQVSKTRSSRDCIFFFNFSMRSYNHKRKKNKQSNYSGYVSFQSQLRTVMLARSKDISGGHVIMSPS